MDKLFAFAENHLKAFAALALLGLLLFLPGFFSIPPIDRDEARFAQASKQMIETGDYFDIRYQDEARYKKPVGIYWLQAAATHVWGAPPYNEIWTYRVPSLLAAIGALWLTYLIGRTLVSAPVGFGAALLLASSLILSVEARLAKTDAMLLLTVLLAMWQVAKAFSRPADQQTSRPEIIVFWLAIAGGILIKGPIIILVVFGAIAVLTICHPGQARGDRWVLLKKLCPLLGLCITAACIAPWLIAITMKSNGAFWAESVGHDMLGKVTAGQESHGLPPGTHIVFLILLFLPAMFAVARGLWHGWKNRTDRIILFLWAWILPTWIIFELTPTKLPHYLMPIYPAIAILGAIAIGDSQVTVPSVRRAFLFPVAITAALNIALLGLIAPQLQNFWLSKEIQTAAAGRRVILVGYHEPSAVFLNGTDTLLLSSLDEALTVCKQDCVMVVTDEKLEQFYAAHGGMIWPAREIGREITGMNIGRGKTITMHLFHAENMGTLD